MSLRTQAKVLRALEEQRFEPVGAAESVQVDVRVVAATNKNLEEEIERGNFREDLFYRLNVIPFFVPPLRDRREDIPLLADHFLREFTTAYGRKPKELTPEAYQLLCGIPLAGQRARAEKPDRAHRDSEPAGARGRAPHPAVRRAARRTARSTASAACRKCARPPSANTSSRNWRRPAATSPAPPNCWAWSAAISTARCARWKSGRRSRAALRPGGWPNPAATARKRPPTSRKLASGTAAPSCGVGPCGVRRPRAVCSPAAGGAVLKAAFSKSQW